MSQQAFDDFAKMVDGSPELKKAANEAYQKLGDSLSQAHMAYFQSIVELGKQNGFEFSATDVMKKFDSAREELDDTQLEAVAGGLELQSYQADTPPTYTYDPRLPGYNVSLTDTSLSPSPGTTTSGT